MTDRMTVQVIVLTGSMGAGKTTVLGEASDLLSARGVVHAVIDLDGLAAAGLSDEVSTGLTYANLAVVWSNFARAGITRLLLAEAVETAEELSRIRAAIPDSTVVVCRLTATIETTQSRLAPASPACCNRRSWRGPASLMRSWSERAWKTSACRTTTGPSRTSPQMF